MIAKRSSLVAVIVLGLVFVACAGEEKKNQQLRPYSGPRDSGADANENADASGDDASPQPIVDAAADTVDAAPVDTYVSDLGYVVVANGYGAAEKDKSNGEMGDADGNTITLEGVQYAKGLGVHAASEITLALGGQYKMFLSDIGVDDEVGAAGLVVFRVLADDVQIYDSGQMAGDTPTKQVAVDISGKNTLKLVVGEEGDFSSDHADWANARLRK